MNKEKHPNLVNYALSYAEHGFSVIPIGNNKRPLIKFADKPPLNNTEIREAWKKYPTANIALKTDKFFVVDVDVHHDKDGMESIKKLGHAEWFENTLTERSASGGYHYYFKKPKNISIKQHIGILPNVDIKAHENNYVVVAPSVINDKAYEWLNHKPMKEPPKGLIDWILEHQKNDNKAFFKASYQPIGKTQTSKLFEKIANGLGDKGCRNNNLASFVGSLLYRDVDPEAVANLAVIANDNTPDPLPLKEVEITFNSVLENEVQKREQNEERIKQIEQALKRNKVE